MKQPPIDAIEERRELPFVGRVNHQHAAAFWNSTTATIATRPTAVAATLLMATLVNNTPGPVTAIKVTYDINTNSIFSEEIDGRIYTQIGNSAPEVAIGILHEIYPKRMPKDELIKSLKRHTFSDNNANVAIGRIKKYVDIDDEHPIRLRNTGVQAVASRKKPKKRHR
jgi:hypothetical protein